MSSEFLKRAQGAAKQVQAARKSRERMESAAAAKFERAQNSYDDARRAYEMSCFHAAQEEAAAWSELMGSLGVGVDVAAQIVGVDAAHVKSVMSSAERPPST